MWRDAAASLPARVPGARVCFAFVSEEAGDLLSGPRVDLLYVFGPERHTGLLHWNDEASWYEGETFVVAMELSKYCRLVMKRNPQGLRLWRTAEQAGLHAWPPALLIDGPVATWVEPLSAWLHGLRSGEDASI